MADNSLQVNLEDSPASNPEDSPASKPEDMDPLADSPATLDQGHSPATLDQGHSPATIDQGHTLASLSQQQLTMDCEEVVDSILTQVVVCSELGVHGLGPDTTCMSATCTLGGVNPTSDLSAALAELVSSNVRYRRKVLFNCGKCSQILSNSTSCGCGQPTDFPKLIFRKTFAKVMSFLTKLEALTKSRTNSSPKSHVSIHRWASYLMSSHTVPYTGLLINASGINKRVTCSCFQAEVPIRAKLETVQGDTVAPNVSGTNNSEVG